jgi:hypothetical protein
LLHQAKDDASSDADGSGKDAQGPDKSAKQPALAVPTPVPVPVAQQTVAPIVGFLAWSSTTGKPEKSTGPAEHDEQTASTGEKKPDATATTAGATLLMQAIAGLGVPQFTQPPSGQQAANNPSGKSGGRADVRASAATAVTGLTTPTNAQAVKPGSRVDVSVSAAALAATGVSTPTNAQAVKPGSRVDVSVSAAALAATGVSTPTNAQTVKPGSRVDVRAGVVAAASGVLTPANTQANVAADDASPSLSVSVGADASGKDGNTGTLVPTAPPDGDGKAPLSSGQLAFAARLNADTPSAQPPALPQPSPLTQPQASHLQAAQASAQSPPAPEADAIQPPPAVTQAVPAGPEQAGEHTQKSEGQALAAPSAAAEQAAVPRADAAHTLDQPADVRSADVDQTPAAGANASAVRDVRLQVAGSDNQRVDVRVMDRGGELRVSVRADDPSLVRSLQDNVAELSNRLDQAHFRSEVWTPRTQAISQTDSASTNGRTFSNGGQAFGRDGQGQQQNGRQQQHPSWVDDFEENPAGRNSGGTPQWQP